MRKGKKAAVSFKARRRRGNWAEGAERSKANQGLRNQSQSLKEEGRAKSFMKIARMDLKGVLGWAMWRKSWEE